MKNNEEEMPAEIMKELEGVVTRQCLQLICMEALLETPERGKKVAEFMKKLMCDFLEFNLAERTLIVKFVNETEEAVNEAMEASNGYDQPLIVLMPQLQELIKRAGIMADVAVARRKEKENRANN